MIGRAGHGSVSNTAGIHSVDDLILGFLAGGTSEYRMLGSGAELDTGNEIIGALGEGTFHQLFGLHTIQNDLIVGQNGIGFYAQTGGETIVTDLNGVADGLILGQQVGSMGSYELSLTGSLEAPLEIIGDAGTGTFIQTGGTNTTVIVRLGNTTDGDGEYNLSGGDLFTQVESIGLSGPGTFNQHGGLNDVDQLAVGIASGVSGSYDLTNGTLMVNNEARIGVDGDGDFNQSGGLHHAAGLVTLGQFELGNGLYHQTGGEFHALAGLDVGLSGIGEYNLEAGLLMVGGLFIGVINQGEGVFHQSGGTVNADNVVLGLEDSSTGEYHLTGGILDIAENLQLGDDSADAEGLFVMGAELNGDAVAIAAEHPGPELHSNEEQIGDDGFGKFIQHSGVHHVEVDLILGQEEFGEGEYYLFGGLLEIGDTLYLGDEDPDAEGLFVMGAEPNGDGVAIAAEGPGPELHSNEEQIGDEGFGNFIQHSGVHHVETDVSLGQEGFGEGEYHLFGGLFEIGDTLYLGDDSPNTKGLFEMHGGELRTDSEQIGDEGFGKFIQSAGTHDVTHDVALGQEDFGMGEYHLSGGLFNIGVSANENGVLFLADDGPDTEGLFIMTGGELNVFEEHVGSEGFGRFEQDAGIHKVQTFLLIGHELGSEGEFELGGTGSLSANDTLVGDEGKGLFTQTGGDNTAFFDLTLGATSDGEGTYNLSAGTLSAGSAIVGNRGVGEFLQSGGRVDLTNDLTMGNATGAAEGKYNLSGDGELETQGQMIGVNGIGEFNQTGGTNTVRDTLSLGMFAGEGDYILEDGALIALHELIGNQGTGTFLQTGGRNIVAGDFFLARVLGGDGAYTLDDGELKANNQTIAHSGEGHFIQNGGENTVDDTLHVVRNGAIIGLYDLNGGQLTAKDIINDGDFLFTGGDLSVGDGNSGELKNNGTFELAGGGTRTVQGDVTNDGTLKTTDTTAVFTGMFVNNGLFFSDPSDNFFQDLIVNSSGHLTGGVGDNFFISNSFANHSTQNTLWNTDDAFLGFGFDQATGALTGLTLDFFLAASDLGVTGYTDNFAWDTLELAPGNTLRLLDGNVANTGTALYVDSLIGAQILGDTISNIIGGMNGLNVYYSATEPGNAYLDGWNYRLAGGGFLMGVDGRGELFPSGPGGPAAPEPSTLVLFAVGVVGLLVRRRRSGVISVAS